MVYECPQCKTPLPPGVMACAKCGLQFATAIPADATVPAPGQPQQPQSMITAGYLPLAVDAVPPRRVVAIVAALGVILVAAALFAIYTFSHTPASDTSASAPPAASPLPPPPSPNLPSGASTRGASGVPSAPTVNLAPVQLSGGSGSSGGTGTAASSDDAALQGRWQAKNLDFYVFNSDGTGSRGNSNNPAKADNFTWVVTGSQLVLNGKKEERMSFSTGPEATILYLHTPDGHYTQFAKQSAS